MQLGEIDDFVMLSALQHYSYCPRQCALIHVEQVFDENVHTMRGNAAHRHVDQPGSESFEGVRSERSVPVWSERLGLIGKCDTVEFYPDGRIYPVEYKHGKRRIKLHDDLQLAAQAICLEEMSGRVVTHGAIYHHTSRRRREVVITEQLRLQVEETVAAVRNLLASDFLPVPVNDTRCKECSLKDICQPEVLTDKVCQKNILSTLYYPDS